MSDYLDHEVQVRNERAAREQKNRAAIEEGMRQAAQEERRKLNEDPAVLGALRRIEAGERLEEAEANRRIAEEEYTRHEQARAELEREKEHRLTVWMTSGGDPADFERAWPQMVSEIMAEKQQERLRQQRQSSVF